MVIYRGEGQGKKLSWVRYLLRRIKQNKNNLIAIIGKTGSGKTYTAMSICEMISKANGVHFGIENVVFGPRPLMQLINSGTLKKGSSIIFDEPQISISAREWQSKANRVFNYLLSTFRHRNLNLFFCTPYEDLLDKSTRKLFHAKFETQKINFNNNTCRIKPKVLDYNSQKQKFYEKFLRVSYKSKGRIKYKTKKLRFWSIPKPSVELIKQYEEKKLNFTTKLNKEIEFALDIAEAGKLPKRKRLTEKQERAMTLLAKLEEVKLVSKELGISIKSTYNHIKVAKDKGYKVEEFKK